MKTGREWCSRLGMSLRYERAQKSFFICHKVQGRSLTSTSPGEALQIPAVCAGVATLLEQPCINPLIMLQHLHKGCQFSNVSFIRSWMSSGARGGSREGAMLQHMVCVRELQLEPAFPKCFLNCTFVGIQMQCWKPLEIQWQLEALNPHLAWVCKAFCFYPLIHILKFRLNLELLMTKYEALCNWLDTHFSAKCSVMSLKVLSLYKITWNNASKWHQWGSAHRCCEPGAGNSAMLVIL